MAGAGFLGGTSAGIMALTDLAVITGGDSWEALVGTLSIIYISIIYICI